MVGRPKKPKDKIVKVPGQFDKDEAFGLTEMQTAFVFHYTEGASSQTDAARKAGYEFPSAAANKLLNGKDYPNVVKAISVKQEELRQRYAITPQKTGTMLWKIMETAYENGQYNAAVSAIKELNQLGGLSINRSQSININANLDSMNKDQIKERLGQILGANGSDYDRKDR